MNIDLEALQNPILKPINYTFKSGTSYGIVGDNGAGKTTLLRLLAGISKPTGGRILYNGESLSFEQVRSPGIIYLAAKPFMFKGSVQKNLHLPLKSRRLNSLERHQRIDPLLKALGLWDLRHRSATRLSSGEMQKVALVRALAIKPAVLLLDEPTSNLDSESILIVENLIQALMHDQGTTLLMVSHDRDQLKRMACTLIRIDKGNLILPNRESLYAAPQDTEEGILDAECTEY